MLQKLENAYLAILRFVVIVVAGILLVTVLIVGFNSFKAIQFEPTAEKTAPKVTPQELIASIGEKTQPNEPAPSSSQPSEATTDTNMVHYQKAAELVIKFVNEHAAGWQQASIQGAIDVIKAKAESFEDPMYIEAYAKGFPEALEKTLIDPKVISHAQKTSPLDVINTALSTYTSNFKDQIEKANFEYTKKLNAYHERKAEGIQSLYIAAGAFAAFLAIIFLSIIIRIERNLRHLENRNTPNQVI